MNMKLLLAAGALLASTSAFAQTEPASEQSSDDLVCQLSGDCGGADLEATEDKPESRGFKIARKTDTPTKTSASATVDRSRARIAPETPRTAAAVASAPGRKREMDRKRLEALEQLAAQAEELDMGY